MHKHSDSEHLGLWKNNPNRLKNRVKWQKLDTNGSQQSRKVVLCDHGNERWISFKASLLAERLQHLNRVQHQVTWESDANVSKDLETTVDLLDESVKAMTIEEQSNTPNIQNKAPPKFKPTRGGLISNTHSEISRKRDHVFKLTKKGCKVQYFSYKLTYLFFDIVALSFNTFFPT